METAWASTYSQLTHVANASSQCEVGTTRRGNATAITTHHGAKAEQQTSPTIRAPARRRHREATWCHKRQTEWNTPNKEHRPQATSGDANAIAYDRIGRNADSTSGKAVACAHLPQIFPSFATSSTVMAYENVESTTLYFPTAAK